MTSPIHRQVGAKVFISEKSLQNIVNANRSIHASPSDAFVRKCRTIQERALLGEVTRQFLPGYEVNVTFVDGQTLQMKDHWIEDASLALAAGKLKTTVSEAEKAAWARADGAQSAPTPAAPKKVWPIDIPLRTAREITIENFGELGKVVVPKGTRVTATTACGKSDGSWFFVDDLRFMPESLAKHDATYYGIRVEADDVEPMSMTVPDLEQSSAPSP